MGRIGERPGHAPTLTESKPRIQAASTRVRPVLVRGTMDGEVRTVRPMTRLASGIFGLVALAHVLRLAFQVEVVVGGWRVPMAISVFGALVPAALAFFLWRESGAGRPPA